MHRTLQAGVLEVAGRNLRHTDTVRLFEVCSVYVPSPGEKLPAEPRRLVIVLSGKRRPEHWDEAGQAVGTLDFFDLKGVVEALLADLHLADVGYRPAKEAMLHPGKAAEVVCGEQVVGTLGELHPKVAEAFDLAGRAVQVAELRLDVLRAALPPRYA
jgi:phenylalanyl-tRNA synthetase beta chain